MTDRLIPSTISILVCLGLGCFVLSRNPKRLANIGFALGLGSLAISEFGALMVTFYKDPMMALFWMKVGIAGEAFFPGSWLLFSLTFARGNASAILRQWGWGLAGFFLVPFCFLAVQGSTSLIVTPSIIVPLSVFPVTQTGFVFYFVFLIALIGVLINLEQTFRASAGLSRWKIKYMILGTGAILSLGVYKAGQILLFSEIRLDLIPIHSTGVVIVSLLIIFSIVRHRLLDVDLFVSRYVLYNSVTLLLSGSYLLFVGLAVYVIQSFGGAAYVPFIPLLIFVALLGLMVLLLSDQFSRKIKRFINLHFYKNKHDYRIKWQEFNDAVGAKMNLSDLFPSFVVWLSDTIGTNEVSVWLQDSKTVFSEQCLAIGKGRSVTWDSSFVRFIEQHDGPVLVDEMGGNAAWLRSVEENDAFLKSILASVFVPIRSKQKMIGFVALGKKITKDSYDYHDMEFLMTIADETARQIDRLRLSEELSVAKEMEAFHHLSSFFLHDLKNHVSTLYMLGQNALKHWETPEFQEDAFNTIRKTADKMNELIKHISMASKTLRLSRTEGDLNVLIKKTYSGFNCTRLAHIKENFGKLPPFLFDHDLLSKVIHNLLINACEAIDDTGEVLIETKADEDNVYFSIADNGCGISTGFLSNNLFKPLQTTKPAGWGIGLFQCQQSVKAHGGTIEVESEVGKGSIFRVVLPIVLEGIVSDA